MSMKLQLNKFNVKRVGFADRTTFHEGILNVCREELKALLEADRNLNRVDIELTHPGENVRILQVSDIIEPRARRDGGDFPGILSPTVTMVGNGVTDVLSGAAVVLLDECGDNCGNAHDAMGNTIDMIGLGAEISTYGSTCNVCLIPYAADGVDPLGPEFKIACKTAAAKAAVYLAQACRDLKPDKVEVYELPPLAKISNDMADLPKVVYVFNMYRYYLNNEFAIYGKTYSWLPSVLMHPNEFFDGAVVNPYLNANLPAPPTIDTYTIQNHPVIKELYRRHGEELCFLGVIPTIAQLDDSSMESQANVAVKLSLALGADGIVLTKAPGGSPQFDVAHVATKAWELGIKSVLILDDIAGRSPDGKFRTTGVIFGDQRAGAIVNTGNISERLTLPPVGRTIGRFVTGADGELLRTRSQLIGQGAQLGSFRTIEVEY